ncbi:MAG: nickel pincer cofactor biosynthesis protein LarC, partial [Trueperaceae bacterium]
DHGAHDHGAHTHAPHRPYSEIRNLLEGADLPLRVRQRALGVFAELARAEGAVHGVPPDQVHFHEVGSTDAIIDVVGCCLALEELGIDTLESSPLHLGSGFVTAAHGRLPIPAPATLRLLEGLAAYQTDIKGELTTPTGAALVRALCDRVGPLGLVRIAGVGHGAGSKDRIVPNMVRALLLGEEQPDGLERDEVVELACNIDDMNPQLFAEVFDALFADGALDVWVEPVVMKKGRPGHVLRALCRPEDNEKLSSVLMRETTTLGVRAHKASRVMLGREWIEVGVAGEVVRVKLGRRGAEVWNVAPEYDDCARLAAALGRPLKLIIDEAKAAALTQLRQSTPGRQAAAHMEEPDGS